MSNFFNQSFFDLFLKLVTAILSVVVMVGIILFTVCVMFPCFVIGRIIVTICHTVQFTSKE